MYGSEHLAYQHLLLGLVVIVRLEVFPLPAFDREAEMPPAQTPYKRLQSLNALQLTFRGRGHGAPSGKYSEFLQP